MLDFMVKKNHAKKYILPIRAISYIFISGFLVAIFLFSIRIISLFLIDSTKYYSEAAAVGATLLIVAIGKPIQSVIDRYLDQRYSGVKYEYRKIVRKTTEVLSSIIELDQLLSQMLDIVLDTVNADRGLIILNDVKSSRFEIKSIEDYSAGFNPGSQTDIEETLEEPKLAFDDNQPIFYYLEDKRDSIRKSDILDRKEYKQNRDVMLQFMNTAAIDVAIPILYEERLVGVLGLGAKKSHALYSSEDLDMLKTLMMQMAVSIENARKVEELKKMIELEASYKELQRIGVMKDNFIAMVSHDLRTPMTVIKGYASLLRDHEEKFDEQVRKRYLNIVVEETDRLTRLITDILDIQKFEAGRMKLDFKNVNIVDFVIEAISFFEASAQKKNISIIKKMPELKIFADCDTDRMYQVIANLFSNAVKFTPEGGEIGITVECATLDGSSGVKVSISDNGPGISKEAQAGLFQKFHQAENLIRNKEEGSGLGLALAREIVEYHKGVVGVESEPGAGSTFYFILRTNK